MTSQTSLRIDFATVIEEWFWNGNTRVATLQFSRSTMNLQQLSDSGNFAFILSTSIIVTN